MNANLAKRNDIPAGIFSGVEIFVAKGRAYAMSEGKRLDYLDLPSNIRTAFTKAFRKDKAIVLQLWPNEGSTKAFINWLSCKCGNLDSTPDYNAATGTIIADDNSFCGDCSCAGAGKLCTLPYNLKPLHVATIQMMKQGFTQQQIADKLHRSPETIKSRLEKSKEHFGVHNTAHLASVTPLISAQC